ncbi:recombinase family protein [Stieleria sp. JC731]|uniref:recombinase family protein n=1 Tax=Pirellulaceae TaxID=2691357 RepID=UPI001E5D86D0|nr:recombinase family protein [Stieleria sp. JC731]MCC9598923.1 recombinase family protein [Stieleria sp. JC731]
MLRKKFDYSKSRNVVVYLRMSSENQSKTSPEQQLRAINQRIAARGLPWKIAKVYRDDAVSGKTTLQRPGFQQMIRDIKTGAVATEVILVDTVERFGRMEDLDNYRRQLRVRHGVYVLTADRDFADPDAPGARCIEAIENLRASEDSRIKANDVVRGKIQSIEDGYWPGSPVPFGYKLEVAATEKRRNRDVVHHKLVLDPETAPVVVAMFQASAEHPSWGQQRLANFLNKQDEIPERFKPFHADTVGCRLKNDIYRGTLVWSENSTGLIDERRVIEKNDEEFVIRKEGFCEPIVDAETFEKVDAGIIARARPRQDGGSNGQSRGVNYRYPLTGLVRCGHCGASMVPNSTSPYITKSGEEKVYCSYACPNQRNGICENDCRVKETWLREVIIGKLIERLFPDQDGVESLVAEVQDLVEQQRLADQSQRQGVIPQLEAELSELQSRVGGWSVTLAKPDLPSQLRSTIETQAAQTLNRIMEIENSLESQACESSVFNNLVRPSEIRDRLNRLAEVLDDQCATSINLELSMHIDRIDCFKEGRVVSRTCKIGSVPNAVAWFSETSEIVSSADDEPNNGYQTKPRRRAWMRIHDESFSNERLRDQINMATDPHRFAMLPNDWFWIDVFQIPERSCWTKDNRDAVRRRYQEVQSATGRKPSANALAREFGVSRPTILAALDHAQRDDTVVPQHRRQPTIKVKGNPNVEAEIARLHDSGMSNKEIGSVVGIGRSTVTKALDRLYEDRGVPRPDGRATRYKQRV